MCLQSCGQPVISSPHRVSLLFDLLENMTELGVQWSWKPLCPLSHSPSLPLHRPSTADSYFPISHLHNTKPLLVASTSVGTKAGALIYQVILVLTKNLAFHCVKCDGSTRKKGICRVHACFRLESHFWGTSWCIFSLMGQALLIMGLKRTKMRPVKGWLQHSQPLHVNSIAVEIIHFSDVHFSFHPGWNTRGDININNTGVYINMHSSFLREWGKPYFGHFTHPSFPALFRYASIPSKMLTNCCRSELPV